MNNIKYQKLIRKYSDDGGLSWNILYDNGKPVYKVGKLLEDPSNCTSPDTYRVKWEKIENTYFCKDFDKYAKAQKLYSYDGIIWNPTYEYGEILIEKNSADCGFLPQDPIYQWVADGYLCNNKDKYAQEKEQKSVDNGVSWQDTGKVRQGALIEKNSVDCGYVPPEAIYQWVADGYLCNGVNKYVKEKEQKSIDKGVSWQDTGRIRQGALLEENSADCGYVPPLNKNTLSFEYNGNKFQKYTINNKKFVSTASPFSIDIVKDLNIATFTSAKNMFSQGIDESGLGIFSTITKITSIPDTSNVTDMKSMFSSCKDLIFLDLTNLNTINANNMGSMFANCKYLTKLDISKFNTSNVTNMSSMFYDCRYLTELDVSRFDTRQVIDISGMFWECSSLTSLDLSNFDTSKVDKMSYMFYGCTSLTSLDLSNWDLNNVTAMSSVFSDCTALKTIYMKNCSQPTIDKIKNQLTTDGITGVTIITQ